MVTAITDMPGLGAASVGGLSIVIEKVTWVIET